MRTSPWFAGTVIAALLVSSWAVGYAVGGAGVAAPHWFYIPIALAAPALAIWVRRSPQSSRGL